jgi:hypothetical protein
MPNLNPRTEGREFPVICIHGPSGSGKTRAAATVSAHHKLRPKAERTSMIELTDVLWFLFDKDGLQSLQSQAMEPLYYDFSYMPPEVPKWLVAVYSRLEEARAKIPELGVQYVVIDTLSSLCTYLDSYYLSSGNIKDPRLAYGESQKRFREILLHLRALPCAQIWLCHSRSAYIDPDKVTDLQKAQRQASKPGEYPVDLGLTRGWADIVRPIPNLTMGLDVENPDTTAKRYFITSAGGDYYVKNRYDDLLQPKEPVDLRAIFQRIDAFEAALKQQRKVP